MNIKDIYIRDPYILLYEGVYYGDDFWATSDFWAPEVHIWRGAFYMLASFKSDTACRGTQILRADAPDAEFKPISSGMITPPDWDCLDGTLYKDKNGKLHIVFCHEWQQIGDGTICEMSLSKDMMTPVSEPRILWKASDFADSVNVSNDGRLSLVTDGPFMLRTENDDLYCIWSTFSDAGYLVCLAKSSNGDIDGSWTVYQTPLCANNSGHGMVSGNCGKANEVLVLTVAKETDTPLSDMSVSEVKNNLCYIGETTSDSDGNYEIRIKLTDAYGKYKVNVRHSSGGKQSTCAFN